MKTGAEVHFLAGQIFTIGIAAVAIIPRMPSDEGGCTIGGNLSHPFRRALLVLIAIGLVRVIGCHITNKDTAMLRLVDAILGTTHVVGQSFLCLTMAYIMQCELVNHVNIEGGVPGRSLAPTLVLILILTIMGAALSETHPKFSCLGNLAEACSCLPILKTLKVYSSVTTVGGNQHGRGPVMTQILKVIEYWYLLTSILSFLGDAIDGDTTDNDLENTNFVQLLFLAIRQNQDNGVDDWTRLVLHSVFLNSIDELHHVTSFTGSSDPSRSHSDGDVNTGDAGFEEHQNDSGSEHNELALRHRLRNTNV